MLVDIIKQHTDVDFKLSIYHEFVASTMLRGFRWARMHREKDGGVTIWNLRCPGISQNVPNKEVGDRYEKWFKWMKGETNDNKGNSRKNG